MLCPLGPSPVPRFPVDWVVRWPRVPALLVLSGNELGLAPSFLLVFGGGCCITGRRSPYIYTLYSEPAGRAGGMHKDTPTIIIQLRFRPIMV